MNLSERLIDLRKKHGLSQQEFAEKQNVTRQTVSKWESGATLPNGERLIQLSKLYGVTVEYLMNGTGEPPKLPAQATDLAKPKNLKWGVAVTFVAVVAALLLVAFICMSTAEKDSTEKIPLSSLKGEPINSTSRDKFQFD